MIGALRAELARTTRRGSVWALTGCVVAIAVLVALHNVGLVGRAQQILASAQGERAVDGCIVYADGSPSGFCPGRPQVQPPPSGSGAVTAHTVTGDPQTFIDADVTAARSDLDGTLQALAPSERVNLTLALLGSIPGIALAIVLGALIGGSDYAWGTTRTNLLAARSRTALVAGRIAAMWIVLLGWLVFGAVGAEVGYALDAPPGLAAVGVPQVSASIALGAWLSLGLFATVTALLSMSMRSALGGAATGTGLFATARFLPQLVGRDLGWLDPLRTIARALTPEPLFAAASSGAAPTAAFGLPSPADGSGASPGTAALILSLFVASLVALGAAWAVSARQEVR